jgi:hypothetical protein
MSKNKDIYEEFCSDWLWKGKYIIVIINQTKVLAALVRLLLKMLNFKSDRLLGVCRIITILAAGKKIHKAKVSF